MAADRADERMLKNKKRPNEPDMFLKIKDRRGIGTRELPG